MFWVGVKVIFFRQVYGIKRRWIMALCTVLYTVFFLLLLPLTRTSEEPEPRPPGGDGDAGTRGTVVFGERHTAIPEPYPMEIAVMPNDQTTQELMSKANYILEHDGRFFSASSEHLTFVEDLAHVRQTLEKSVRPAVGVEFHEMNRTRLNYTLRPVLISHSSKFIKIFPPFALAQEVTPTNNVMPNALLRLQAAIDAAYIQTYFPDVNHLRIRTFPDYPFEDDGNERRANFDEESNVYSAAILMSWSLLMMMSMLASYIISDKLSGVRELLCVNGLPRWMVNTSWLIAFMLLGLIVALLQLTMVLLPANNPSIKFISIPLLLVFLILHGWSALALVCLVANLFASQLAAILIIVLYWIVTMVAGLSLVVRTTLNNLFVVQSFLAMVPNYGYALFIKVLLESYHEQSGLSFNNITKAQANYISAGLILLMMFVGICIMLILAAYIDLVKPGPYGRARPWYLFDFNSKMSEAAVAPADAGSLNEGSLFEKIKDDEPIGLKCVNIVKIFGTYKALNNVNLKIAKNKVTVLLGHNGAGKSTLFSILCGMYSPTSGNVYTDEYSVFEGSNIHKFRSVLGYCPQENLLLNELSVQEHLIVFGMLKGLSMAEARDYSDNWTAMFDMINFRNVQAKKLSGGTKRKLCLAIAMTGKPQFILLDEPSAGMDIESTRKMWDVLLAEKGKCTVVITTHNMDEAEILGDRIAILAFGQLKCLGTSSFLKKALDSGYRLNCVAMNKDTDVVIKFVSRALRGASVMYKTNRSVTFNLPSSLISNVPDLLRALEKEFGETVSSTLALSTLDDVFIEVQKDVGVKVNVEEVPAMDDDEMSRSWCNCEELFSRRLRWLLSKVVLTFIYMVILLPNLAMIGGIFLLYSAARNQSSAAPDGPPGRFAVISQHHDDVSDFLRSALSKDGITFKETNFQPNQTLMDMTRENFSEHRSKLLFAFNANDSDNPSAYFSSKIDDTAFTAYSALVNALLQGNATIITQTAPFGYQNFKANLTCPIHLAPALAVMFFLVVGPFFLVACAYFVVFPHHERTTLFKHLQLMTGLLPEIYWAVNLLFDFAAFVCCCILTVVVIACLKDIVDIFWELNVLGAFISSLLLYGLSSILLSYVGSFFFRSPAMSILTIILASFLLSIVFAILESTNRLSFEWVFFLPWPVLWNALHKIILWAFERRNCAECSYECDKFQGKLLFSQLQFEFICFAALSVGYFMILLLFDHGIVRAFLGLVQKACFGEIKQATKGVDPEVALEKKRVEKLREEDDWPELVCDGLGKKYSFSRTAVYDVTLTAERGECFGLVGVNGAGKSTTFGMLSGLLAPTKGTAVIEGKWKVTGCNYKYLKRVGYCPQYEGLLGELPGKTIIRLFGRLGGVPRNRIKQLTERWIEALDMKEISHRPCGHYSGGNKRKLSLAMALIGNPPVVLLDEPTAGVDPVVRRKIWEILTTSLELHGRTIILTSHTMSECEAICDRLTIMVKGVMKCLGPIPVLKKTFGKSCILEVKFTANSTKKQQNAAQSKIESQFAGFITPRESQLNRVVYFLQPENIMIYDMFATMLRIQADSSVIEDFNLTETPLEQVFLMFAKK